MSALALLGLGAGLSGCFTTAQPETDQSPKTTAMASPPPRDPPPSIAKPASRPPTRYMTSVPNFDPLADFNHDPIYGSDRMSFEILCCPAHQGGDRPDPFDPLIQ